MSDWLIYHKKPITLHSGGKSHWFVDGQAIFDDPNLRESVLKCWGEAIHSLVQSHEDFLFIGVPRGGIRWAEAIAERCGGEAALPGKYQIRQHRLIVAVDDVVTTGASLDSVQADWKLAVVSRLPVWERKRLNAWAWISLEEEP